ncbi:MAG TPA: galactokinase [Acidobacteriaceae bacterium]|nr:galactokinase [Acidobacteriaceae bacterium]
MTESDQRCRNAPAGVREFVAPGRVNLLGEHTDYTGGLVLPMAIPFTTVASIAPASDGRYSFTSDSFEESRSVATSDRITPAGNWSDYPAGVLRELMDAGVQPPPFLLRVRGDVPLGAGLSSSASVEVASAVAMLAHAGARLPPAEIAVLCRRAENEFVGSPCGIMDQFVITTARAGHALLLDTSSLRYEHVPINTGNFAAYRVVVVNSMVRHSIKGGGYGDRRREVEVGQAVLRRHFPEVRQLGDATLEQLEACEAEMPEESFRRCRHIVTENARVHAAREAMLAGDALRMGELMLAAHASERDDFACSCEEIDFLVEAAAASSGCAGARLTGGGFGGCTVNLVMVERVEEFVVVVTKAYRERFGIIAQSYVCEAADGAVRRNPQVAAEECVA